MSSKATYGPDRRESAVCHDFWLTHFVGMLLANLADWV